MINDKFTLFHSVFIPLQTHTICKSFTMKGNCQMNKTKEYAKDIMEDFIKRYPVPMNVQKAIDTLSDEDWKLYLKNKDYLKDQGGQDVNS